jgi:hypothetical protein
MNTPSKGKDQWYWSTTSCHVYGSVSGSNSKTPASISIDQVFDFVTLASNRSDCTEDFGTGEKAKAPV